MDFGIEETQVHDETLEVIRWGVDETPDDFLKPNDGVISEVVSACLRQMEKDNKLS